jgi:dipeptidyl aminopeptidase/acylaminoacyl peptidase
VSTEAPFGAWTSPITPEALVAGAVGLHEVQADGDDLWWDESRPEEGGRIQLVRRAPDGATTDVLPDGFAARTRVHEYGGGAWRVHAGVLWFSNWSDQRLHRLDPGAEPRPLTPEGCRYADMDVAPDGTWLVAVREDHRGEGEAKNEIVAIDGDTGEELVLVTGPDFVASPRLGRDGQRLAWTQWDHPDMPWDAAEVWVGRLDADGLVDAERLAGGPGEWASQPTWQGARLWLTSDLNPAYRQPGVLTEVVMSRPPFWRRWFGARDEAPAVRLPPKPGADFAEVYCWDGGDLEPVTTHSAGDVATPPWVFRMSTIVPDADEPDGDPHGTVAVTRDGVDHLVRIDGGTQVEVPTPYTAWSSLTGAPEGFVAVAAGFADEPAIVRVGIPSKVAISDADEPVAPSASGTPEVEVIRAPRDLGLSSEQISRPESIDFPSAGGRTAHALYYPPTNPDHVGPDGEKPPLLVDIHGGPTGAARSQFQLSTQFWTSRGFAVVDVNYGGSTGYGRAYRDLLKGQWGVVDVEDCVAAARFLADRGDVDPDRLAIRGGSAGGFTTLAALAFHDTFAAGVSKYGVADLAVLAQETHKFESRYLDGLIGPWPEAEATYRERSPLFHADQIRVPLLVLQGLEDEVVPPNQSQMIVDALEANGIPVSYLTFEGEQHGFRKAETIVAATEAELAFYGEVFGFTPT